MAAENTALCVLAAAILVAGCRKKEEPVVDWPKDPEVAEARKELQNVAPDAGDEGALQSAGSYGAKVPPHFPEDVPLSKELVVNDAREIGERFALSFTAACDVREIAGEFAKDLRGKGWKLSSNEVSDKDAFINGEKDDRTITVVVERKGMGCVVELDVARQMEEDEE